MNANSPISRQGNRLTGHIYSHQDMRYTCCYFKVARTSFSKIYNIPIDWKMCDFINNIKGYCSQDFPGTVLTSNIEIVLVGNDPLQGRAAEDADALALTQDDTETFYEKYISRNVFPSFYIRNTINIIPDTDDDARNHRRRLEEDTSSAEAERARQEQDQNIICMICLEDNVAMLRLTCSHELCTTCFTRCLTYGHHRCPLCRRNTVFRDMIH
jgi:hypothetical protein